MTALDVKLFVGYVDFTLNHVSRVQYVFIITINNTNPYYSTKYQFVLHQTVDLILPNQGKIKEPTWKLYALTKHCSQRDGKT